MLGVTYQINVLSVALTADLQVQLFFPILQQIVGCFTKIVCPINTTATSDSACSIYLFGFRTKG